MTPPITPSPRPKRSRPTLSIVLAVLALAACALGHVHLRLSVLQAGYDLSRESRLRHDLEDQNQKLRLELDTRRDPSLIERRAQAELHMAPPAAGSVRTLRLLPGAGTGHALLLDSAGHPTATAAITAPSVAPAAMQHDTVDRTPPAMQQSSSALQQVGSPATGDRP